MLIVGQPGIHLNMSYHGGQKSVERDYMELGLCAVCHNEIKVSRNIFGKVIQAKACLICQKNIMNEKTNCSIWTICGGAGTGKTTLFNLLAGTERKTSSALLSETSCEETIKDVLRPQYCCIQGYESIFLVDSEGINGLRIDHSEEATVDVHVAILKQTCVRMEAGSSGIVLTLACGERCDKASFEFITLLSKTLGKFPLIVCITKCDRFKNPANKHDMLSTAATWWTGASREFEMMIRPYVSTIDVAYIAMPDENGNQELMYFEDLLSCMSRRNGVQIETIRKKLEDQELSSMNVVMTIEQAALLDESISKKLMHLFSTDQTIYKTFLGNSGRAVLTFITSPILLALSPALVPAMLISKYQNIREQIKKRRIFKHEDNAHRATIQNKSHQPKEKKSDTVCVIH